MLQEHPQTKRHEDWDVRFVFSQAPQAGNLLSIQSLSNLQALTDGFDGSSRTLRCDWLSGYCVVDVGGDMELQQLRELADDVLRRAILFLTSQLHVCLHNLRELVC